MAKDKPKKVTSRDERDKQAKQRANVKAAQNKLSKTRAKTHKPSKGENQEI